MERYSIYPWSSPVSQRPKYGGGVCMILVRAATPTGKTVRGRVLTELQRVPDGQSFAHSAEVPYVGEPKAGIYIVSSHIHLHSHRVVVWAG